MFMVLFDVAPHPAQMHEYLSFAKLLRPELEQIRGFIDNERFTDVKHPERVLSLSTWANEKALIRWRTHAQHHQVQHQGRGWVFADYRLRVGEVTADSALQSEQTLPQQRFDATETSAVTSVVVLEFHASSHGSVLEQVIRAATRDPAYAPEGWVEGTQYTSITQPDKQLLVLGWTTPEAAHTWHATQIDACGRSAVRSRCVRVIRSYGMRERGEAPQYYPAAATTAAIW